MNISELVTKYIEIRDKKAEFKAAYDEKVKKIDDVLLRIEAKLLETFDEAGMNSVKTTNGTAYVSTRTSASVADREVFMEFVKANEEWPLLEVRASKVAVEQYKESHDDLPPGINLRTERVVNVRRSS